MAQDKTFINGIFIKEQKFSNGGSILKMSVIADKLIEELSKYKNASGYVNIDICQKREPDQKGNTHYAVLNEWKKDGGNASKPMTDAEAMEYGRNMYGKNENEADLPF